MVDEIDVHRFAAVHAEGATVIDVREPWEYQGGHVPGAELVPLDTVPVQGRTLPRDEPIYVICASGNRSRTAAGWLTAMGHTAISVAGGTSAWVDAGHETVAGHDRTSAEEAADA